MESIVNAMFLKVFMSFKIVYLHYKQNKHADSLFVALIKISRNTAFEARWKWIK